MRPKVPISLRGLKSRNALGQRRYLLSLLGTALGSQTEQKMLVYLVYGLRKRRSLLNSSPGLNVIPSNSNLEPLPNGGIEDESRGLSVTATSGGING